MSGESHNEFSTLSRRRLMRDMAIFGGLAGALGTVLSPQSAAAKTKLPQKAVSYQLTPKGKAQCDVCTQWQAPAACKTVEGVIAPTAWCSLFALKS